MIIFLSLLVALIGLFIYLARPAPDPNPRMAEVGKIMFFCGLLAFLIQSPALVTLFHK
jgi:hypothetical protein